MYKFSSVKLPKEIKDKVTKVMLKGSDKWYTVDFVSPDGTNLRVLETFGFFEHDAITQYSFDGRA